MPSKYIRKHSRYLFLFSRLYGSYEALKGGTTSEALEDMTGGLTEFYDLNQPPENILQLIVKGFEMGSMFGCSLEADPNQWEAKLPNGLVRKSFSFQLVRLSFERLLALIPNL